MAASKVSSFGDKFLRKAGTLEAETLVSGKAECFLPICEDKKVGFLGVTSFKDHGNRSGKI